MAATFEVAYHFYPDAWGHGYGLEPVREAVSWAGERRFTEVEAWIEPGNDRSTTLALGLGLHATDDSVSESDHNFRPA